VSLSMAGNPGLRLGRHARLTAFFMRFCILRGSMNVRHKMVGFYETESPSVWSTTLASCCFSGQKWQRMY